MAKSIQWGHVERGQLSLSHFYWTGLVHYSVNQYCAHSFARMSRRMRMTVENISRSISTKECCRPGGGQTRNLLITSRTRIRMSHRGRPMLPNTTRDVQRTIVMAAVCYNIEITQVDISVRNFGPISFSLKDDKMRQFAEF